MFLDFGTLHSNLPSSPPKDSARSLPPSPNCTSFNGQPAFFLRHYPFLSSLLPFDHVFLLKSELLRLNSRLIHALFQMNRIHNSEPICSIKSQIKEQKKTG